MLSPLYGQLSPLRIPTRAPRSAVSDADAEAYLQAVETADGSSLEQSVADAVNDFVLGCKSDGIWSAIKASCILAGARTLSGALVPLVGTAPTNYNFVSGDYNRETGLKSNGSTKYLDSNRANNADPQNSNHNAVFIHTAQTAGVGGVYIGSGGSQTGSNNIARSSTSANLVIRQRSGTADVISGIGGSIGLLATNRSSSNSYVLRAGEITSSFTRPAQPPYGASIHAFQRNDGTPATTDARLSFYSIGESLDLAALDTRVSNLMTQINATL